MSKRAGKDRKYILLFRAPTGRSRYTDERSHQTLTRDLRSYTRRIAVDHRITEAWVTHTFRQPPRSLLPLKRGPVGCISIKTRDLHAGLSDDQQSADVPRDGALLDDLLKEVPAGFEAAYAAEEALPLCYERDWPDGEPTPGVCLLTLFHRKPGLDYPTFIRRWHESHTPLSLRLHPLWHYNRNVVRVVRRGGVPRGVRSSTGERRAETGSNLSETHPHRPFDGIVEEHFRTAADLLNPFRFYGRAHVILGNMISILCDVTGFIDLRRIETYLARQIIIKSTHAFTGDCKGALHSSPTAAGPDSLHMHEDPCSSDS